MGNHKREFKSIRREHAGQQSHHGETERPDKLERLQNVPEPPFVIRVGFNKAIVCVNILHNVVRALMMTSVFYLQPMTQRALIEWPWKGQEFRPLYSTLQNNYYYSLDAVFMQSNSE